jgi:hypothetical protein
MPISSIIFMTLLSNASAQNSEYIAHLQNKITVLNEAENRKRPKCPKWWNHPSKPKWHAPVSDPSFEPFSNRGIGCITNPEPPIVLPENQ